MTEFVENNHTSEQTEVEIMGGHNTSQSSIDIRNQRYPHCIVWTPIPMIT